MRKIGTAQFQFDPKLNRLGKGKEIRHGLSVVFQSGHSLWLANDETISLERLTLQREGSEGGLRFGDHRQFTLSDYLKLPVPPPSDAEDIEEADVEGIAVSEGYLWLVGSHSLKRVKPREDDSARKGVKRLATVSSDGNRFLLARIPVVDEADGQTLAKEVEDEGGMRTAALLHGDDTGNDLTRALAQDPHLQAFLAIPGKDNGFDIEGLAIVGERVLLGLRGPVLRGWAVILEILPKQVDGDPARLQLGSLGPDKQPFLKHFLHLDGLGIRDLCVHGDDLLILAGPTMDLDGPVAIFRWLGGAHPARNGLVLREACPSVGAVPFGQGADKGTDHAEGMCLCSADGWEGPAVLVVYDAASPSRLAHAKGAVSADIFALP